MATVCATAKGRAETIPAVKVAITGRIGGPDGETSKTPGVGWPVVTAPPYVVTEDKVPVTLRHAVVLVSYVAYFMFITLGKEVSLV